jgi:hypothetical protein
MVWLVSGAHTALPLSTTLAGPTGVVDVVVLVVDDEVVDVVDDCVVVDSVSVVEAAASVNSGSDVEVVVD